MGLYINKDGHPYVFKNNNNPSAPNQEYIRRNYLKELLQEQQKANKELKETITELETQNQQDKKKQTAQLNSVKQQIDSLSISHQKQIETDDKILQQLDVLDEKHAILQETVSQEGSRTESILMRMDRLSEDNKEMVHRIEKTDAFNQQLSSKLHEQQVLQQDLIEKITNQSSLQNDVVEKLEHQQMIQKELAEKLEHQEEFQTKMLKRLDRQEALTEKIFRQINHIRSILFERTNYLATKVEEGYGLTSSYIYKLITGSDQPLTFTMLKEKKTDDQNK